jgi:hypothetical protein|tara:strand:+ start:1587 stop:1754 length:168 start_codon:yes stop_codon:yes gene_type:complete
LVINSASEQKRGDHSSEFFGTNHAVIHLWFLKNNYEIQGSYSDLQFENDQQDRKR